MSETSHTESVVWTGTVALSSGFAPHPGNLFHTWGTSIPNSRAYPLQSLELSGLLARCTPYFAR